MITALVLIALMGLLTWASVYITKADIEEANVQAEARAAQNNHDKSN